MTKTTKSKPRSAYFIDLREEGGRATHLTANFGHSPNWLVQSGGLSHGAAFAPASVKDADLLIEWLNQWKNRGGQ